MGVMKNEDGYVFIVCCVSDFETLQRYNLVVVVGNSSAVDAGSYYSSSESDN